MALSVTIAIVVPVRLDQTLRALRNLFLAEALDVATGNLNAVASLLGVPRSSLDRVLRDEPELREARRRYQEQAFAERAQARAGRTRRRGKR